VIGGHAEVAAEPATLAVHIGVVLLGRPLGAEQTAYRVVEEPHAGEESERAERVAEQDPGVGAERVVSVK